MEATLVIRNADVDDINAIGFLAHQVWPVAYRDILSLEQLQYMLQLFYSPQALQHQMLREGQHFFIAELDLQEVGFAAYSPISKQVFKLHKLYVLPTLQGKGVGKALLDMVSEEAIQAGAEKIWLNVNRHNKALQFYEQQGFSILKEENIDIGNGFFMNDYVMEKTLNK